MVTVPLYLLTYICFKFLKCQEQRCSLFLNGRIITVVGFKFGVHVIHRTAPATIYIASICKWKTEKWGPFITGLETRMVLIFTKASWLLGQTKFVIGLTRREIGSKSHAIPKNLRISLRVLDTNILETDSTLTLTRTILPSPTSWPRNANLPFPVSTFYEFYSEFSIME